MQRFNTYEFDFEKNEGKILNCVEMITNDKEEISKELWILETESEAVKKANELNKTNNDKRYKYIAINYIVCKDCLQTI